MKTRNIEKIIIILLLSISGIGTLYLFSENRSDGQAAAAYLAGFITVLVGWITYRVAQSAERSADVAVELQRKAHELEERNEAPFIVPMGIHPTLHFEQVYTPNGGDDTKHLWVILSNQGSGAAFGIKSDAVVDRYTNSHVSLSFLKSNGVYLDHRSNAREEYTPYTQRLHLSTEKLPSKDSQSVELRIDYLDSHDREWYTTFSVELFDIQLDPHNQNRMIGGKLRISNIHRCKSNKGKTI